jgi:DNA polymerase-3 subunit gamma/tau
MNQALHLKYRPQTLSELVGQGLIRTTLANAIATSKIAPAYLFTGSRGTGKTSTARIFAKSLNCLATKKPTIKPCGRCQSCRSIEKSISLDVTEIDAASHNGVDDARQLIESSSFAPTQGRYRIFLIDECQMLTTAAQNALLKLIEEPPPRVIFILCTTEIHKVLPTIISRCQTFNFKAHSLDTIVDRLAEIARIEAIDINEEALKLIARNAGGGLRDALQLLSQLSLLGEQITTTHVIDVIGGVNPSELMNIIDYLTNRDTLNVLKIARNLIDSGRTPQLILSNLLQVYRDLLLVKSTSTAKQLITGALSYSQLYKIAQNLDFETIDRNLQHLQKSEYQLRTSVNAATWLEVCLLNLMPETTVPKRAQSNTKNNNLVAIWARVVESAKPNNRNLLSMATLTAIKSDRAILKVDAKCFDRFDRNSKAISLLLSKVLGKKIKVTIEEKTS